MEEGTAFGKWYDPGEAPLPSFERAAEVSTCGRRAGRSGGLTNEKYYREASRALRGAGFEHYEISSYARPGHRSRHNQVYWRNEPFYAFGLGAASLLDRRRVSRPRKMARYYEWVRQFEARPVGPAEDPIADDDPEYRADLMLDVIMLGLRTAEGVDLSRFAREFGSVNAGKAEGAVREHVRAERVEVLEEERGRVMRLTDPEGFLVSNDIISDIFVELA